MKRYLHLLVLSLLIVSGSVQSHQPEHSKLRAVLDPLPAALDGVVVQVHETLAPQLVIENRTVRTLEVLDDKGRPFIRIGPAGVEGDHNAPAWFITFSKAPIPVPESAQQPDAPARWRTVRSDPTWGWFDPRVHPGDTAGDHHAPGPAKPKATAPRTRFEIPMLIEGKPISVTGRFVPKPVLPGRYEARLKPQTTPLPAGVALTVVQGNPPALMLRNTGSAVVTVLGMSDEPYLRLGPAGVEANAASNTWRLYGRGRVVAVSGTEPVQWQKLSPQPLYTWIEPRAEVDLTQPPPKGNQRIAVRSWRIALMIGDQRSIVEGQTDWIPDTPAAANAH